MLDIIKSMEANFKNLLRKHAGIDSDAQTMTLAGNITSTGVIVGNGWGIEGGTFTPAAVSNADIFGNVSSTANVDTVNVTTTNITISGPSVITGKLNVSGNIAAGNFIGNGYNLQGVMSQASQSSGDYVSANLFGNVTSSANIDTWNVITTDMFVSGNVVNNFERPITIYGPLSTSNLNVFTANLETINAYDANVGNLQANGHMFVAGNVYGNYLIGNGFNLSLDGFTVKPQGVVPDQAARLALNVPVGTLVTQTDNGNDYLLTTNPPSSTSSWIEYTGANFPIDTVFGRTGIINLISNTDVKTFGGQSIVGAGDVSQANVDVIGSLTGNVLSVGNVDAANIVTNSLVVNGNMIATTITATGNISGRFLLANVNTIRNLNCVQFSSQDHRIGTSRLYSESKNARGNG